MIDAQVLQKFGVSIGYQMWGELDMIRRFSAAFQLASKLDRLCDGDQRGEYLIRHLELDRLSIEEAEIAREMLDTLLGDSEAKGE